MYNKPYPNEKDKTIMTSPCIMYFYDNIAKKWLKNECKDELRPYIGRNFSHYDQVEMDCKQRMKDIVNKMESRDTKKKIKDHEEFYSRIH